MATVLREPYGTEPLVTDSVVVKNPDADLEVTMQNRANEREVAPVQKARS